MKSSHRRIVHFFLLGLGVILGLPICSFAIIEATAAGDAVFPVECAIVFGAAVGPGSRPGPALVRRVSGASTLYRRHDIQRIILSGGKGTGNRLSEAEVMRRLALQQGVAERDIRVESQSHSTWENLLYAKNLTKDCSSVVAVSDGYHLARIRLLALRQKWQGMGITPAQASKEMTLQERKAIMREVFAYLYYAFYIDRIWKIPSKIETSTESAQTVPASIDLFV